MDEQRLAAAQRHPDRQPTALFAATEGPRDPGCGGSDHER